MGLLVNGVWHDGWYDTTNTGGRFVRKDSAYRNWVTADGASGPSGTGGIRSRRRPLSSLRLAGLPMGAPRPDYASAERPRGDDRPFCGALANARPGLDL